MGGKIRCSDRHRRHLERPWGLWLDCQGIEATQVVAQALEKEERCPGDVDVVVAELIEDGVSAE